MCPPPDLLVCRCSNHHKAFASRSLNPHDVTWEFTERRLEDLAARKHFEVSVQGDRLANPSSTNPGMAAGRVRASLGSGQGASRGRGSAQLKAPPLKLQMPLISTGIARSTAAEQHMHMLLLSPMHMTLSEEMKKWASDNSLLADHAVLPSLMKPYLRLPFDQMTLCVRFPTTSAPYTT